MNILVIGSGGREHAIIDCLSKSKLSPILFCAPGNAGISELAELVDIDINKNIKIIECCKNNNIDLVIIGPEIPLLNGIVDELEQANIKVFGPSKSAALIEGSKEFAKELMVKYKIPTAEYQSFSDFDMAKKYLDNCKIPVVIKYDGLAAGKGVVVATTYEMALKALDDMLVKKIFGNNKVIIEEFLNGPEFSLMCLVNGNQVTPLEIARDYKRAYDDDQGPNTGGMGAYCDVPSISQKIIDQAINEIMIPTALAMVKENRNFTGILYGGLIVTTAGPKVIEFNARFGDPETEVILPRLKSDLLQVILDILDGKEVKLEWHTFKTLGVVIASKGYPSDYQNGFELDLKNTKDIYHMGTVLKNNKPLSNGGRVLFVLGKGVDFTTAQSDAYNKLKKIVTDQFFYRNDIGCKISK